jgi:hypothetical protein
MSFPQTKTARIFMLSAFLSLAGAIVFTFEGGRQEVSVTPSPAIQNDSPSPAPVLEEKTPEISEVKPHYLNKAGNLLTLTELLAELEVDKLLTALAASREQRAKLEPPSPPQLVFPAAPPSIMPAPKPPVSAPVVLPSAPGPPRPQVLSIQGIDGQVMAIVETSSGLRALKVGDSFGSGRVEAISFMGVHVRDGENTQVFAIEE